MEEKYNKERGDRMKKNCHYLLYVLILLIILGTSRAKELKKYACNMGEEMKKTICREVVYESLGEKKILLGDLESSPAFSYLLCRGMGVDEWKQRQLEKKKEEKEEKSTSTIDLVEEENSKMREQEEKFLEQVKSDLNEKQELPEENVKGEKPNQLVEQLKKNKSVNFLLRKFYIVDSTTSVDKSVFQVDKMLKKDYSIKKTKEPKILIFHTHGGTEFFGEEKNKNSIIEVGVELEEQLEKKYGFTVLHDKTKYDYINGSMDRNKAYTKALDGVKKTLEENPSIEVVIDLHRDAGNNKTKRVTQIDGKTVAQFMIFNGLSRNKRGEIAYLHNDNLQDNLAFGLQVKLRAMERYPDLTIKNYLKGYRYNMHLCKRFLLIELGNQNNTVEEAKNTMSYLAEILNDVLTK